MTEIKISHLSNHTPDPEGSSFAFVRPAWTSPAPSLSDSTLQVSTAELHRPLFKTSDSTPRVSTADLPRPIWVKVKDGLGIRRIA